MRQWALTLRQLALICCALCWLSTATSAQESSVPLRRGINIGDFLAYPQSSEWPIFRGPRAAMTDDDLMRLSRAGFDFVRLAVEPSPFLDRPATEVKILEERLVAIVRRVAAAGMKVIISGWARHETTPRWRAEQIVASTDNTEFRAYMGFLKRIVVLLKDVPVDRWLLEPMNEPQSICKRTDGPDWTVVQRRIYEELRGLAPDLTIVLTTGCWSKIEGLPHLNMSGYDARTLIDVHYYEPYAFTHQGATWGADWLKSLSGLSFPPDRTDRQSATDASARLFQARKTPGGASAFSETVRKIDVYIRENSGPDRVARDMATLRTWADENGVTPDRIIVGEFGAYRQPPEAKLADDGSRARWLETVRTVAEAQGFGWALYAYHSDFGLITDEAKATWDPMMPPALGLKGG